MYFKAEKDQFFSSILTNSLEGEIWPRKDNRNKDNNEEEGKYLDNNSCKLNCSEGHIPIKIELIN